MKKYWKNKRWKNLFRWDCKHYVKIVNLIRWWQAGDPNKTKAICLSNQIKASWMLTRIIIFQWETVNIHSKIPLFLNFWNASKDRMNVTLFSSTFTLIYRWFIIVKEEKIHPQIRWQLTRSSYIWHIQDQRSFG